MGEDFKPGDRVQVQGYDTPGEKATKVDGEQGSVVDYDTADTYVPVKLDRRPLPTEVWMFTPNELVKI
jgi:hypothetical protein